MGKEIPAIGIRKGDPDLLPLILPVKTQTALELNLEEPISGNMLRNEISPLPVVGKPVSHIAVVREHRGELLVVEIFLLPGVERGIGDGEEYGGHGTGRLNGHGIG